MQTFLHVFRTYLKRLLDTFKNFLPPPTPGHLNVFGGCMIYWRISRIFRTTLSRFAFFFFVLFIIPFTLNALNRTLIDTSWQGRCKSIVGVSLLCDVLSFFPISSQPVHMPFLSDVCALIICGILYPIHSVVVLKIFEAASETLQDQYQSGVLKLRQIEYEKILSWYDVRFANCLTVLIPMFFSGYFAWKSCLWRSNIQCWAHPSYGSFGFIAYIFVFFVILHQFILLNTKGILLVHLFYKIYSKPRLVLNLRLFHEDECYGVKKIGDIILLVYITNTIHALTIYLLADYNYFPLNVDVLLFLLFTYLVLGPLYIVFPIRVIHYQMKLFKKEQLKQLNIRFQAYVKVLMNQSLTNPQMLGQISETVDYGKELREYWDLIARMKTFPFALIKTSVFGLTMYVLQIGAITLELLASFPRA